MRKAGQRKRAGALAFAYIVIHLRRMSTSLSFRTEESVRDEIDKIAESLDRNRNWVINKAIESYVEQYNWELQEIDAGLADIEAGRTISAEKFEVKVKEMIAGNTAMKSRRAKKFK